MNRQEFYDRTGEWPEQIIGPKWEDEVERFLEDWGFNSDDGDWKV